jgi:hypothetical protein
VATEWPEQKQNVLFKHKQIKHGIGHWPHWSRIGAVSIFIRRASASPRLEHLHSSGVGVAAVGASSFVGRRRRMSSAVNICIFESSTWVKN